MLKIRRPLGRLIFNMGIAIPGKTVFLIETAPCFMPRPFMWVADLLASFTPPSTPSSSGANMLATHPTFQAKDRITDLVLLNFVAPWYLKNFVLPWYLQKYHRPCLIISSGQRKVPTIIDSLRNWEIMSSFSAHAVPVFAFCFIFALFHFSNSILSLPSTIVFLFHRRSLDTFYDHIDMLRTKQKERHFQGHTIERNLL